MKLRYFLRVVSITSLLLIFGAGVGLVVFQRSGGKVLSVQSGSMEPVLQTGGIVTIKPIVAENIAKGDVITFINPANNDQTITHRVVDVVPSLMAGGKPYVITKGDANLTNDATLIPASSVVGIVKYHVPYLGYAVDFIRQPLGLLLIIYIPALFIIIGEMKHLTNYYRRIKPYSIRNLKTAPGMSHTQLGLIITVNAGLMILGVAVPTLAAIQSSVTLTGNTIKSESKPVDPPYQPGGGTVITCTNNTNVNINSTTNQSATTGNATVNGNTNSGSATSGNASNTSSTSIGINVTNGSCKPT